MTFCICTANSRVGDKHKTCVSLRDVSRLCNIEMEKVAVLPVPDWAWAITSRPLTMGLILRCCMADGFSKPIKDFKKLFVNYFALFRVCALPYA